MQKQKILFITHTHSAGGGAEKVLTTLVNALEPSKYEIAIQEVYAWNVKKEPINNNIKLLKPIIQDDFESEFNKQFKRYCIEQYPNLIRAVNDWEDYDVIISWNYQCPSFLLQAFTDKQTIAWFHGAIDDLNPNTNLKQIKYNYNLQYKSWINVDKIITISNRSLKSLNYFPVFMSKASIIHNAFNIKEVIEKSKQECTFNFEDCNEPFLICIGRLDSNKNFSIVIKALSKLNLEGISCSLIIIGQGQEQTYLENLVNKLNIQDKVFFLGYQQNPIPYILNSKLLCLSSISEGWGVVVCEGMALGKPFITTPVAGASEELADNGKCGLISDWAVDEYAKQIKALLTDEEVYTQMSENCKEKIEEFSIEKTVAKFDDLIFSLSEKKEKKNVEVLSKFIARKKIRKLYIWNFDFATQRLRFAFNRFCVNKNLKDLFISFYHILKLLYYVIITPFRIFTSKKIFNYAPDLSYE